MKKMVRSLVTAQLVAFQVVLSSKKLVNRSIISVRKVAVIQIVMSVAVLLIVLALRAVLTRIAVIVEAAVAVTVTTTEL
jgi:hypothetical protein